MAVEFFCKLGTNFFKGGGNVMSQPQSFCSVSIVRVATLFLGSVNYYGVKTQMPNVYLT